MNVILLEAVENLGSIGDLVKVKPGYGRNYLLPQGKAALATPKNIKEIEARRAELEKAAAEELAKARERAKAFENLEVMIHANAGSEGKLFGSVGPIDIVEALAAVQAADGSLGSSPLRTAGTLNLLDFCCSRGISKFVLASTSSLWRTGGALCSPGFTSTRKPGELMLLRARAP